MQDSSSETSQDITYKINYTYSTLNNKPSSKRLENYEKFINRIHEYDEYVNELLVELEEKKREIFELRKKFTDNQLIECNHTHSLKQQIREDAHIKNDENFLNNMFIIPLEQEKKIFRKKSKKTKRKSSSKTSNNIKKKSNNDITDETVILTDMHNSYIEEEKDSNTK